MNPQDQKAILAIALYAAFADGAKDDRERDEVRRMAESLASGSTAIDLRALYQDVLLKRLTLEQATALLSAEGMRHFAYEMALCVCEADGRITEPERRFMDELKARLALGESQAQGIEHEVESFTAPALAMVPVVLPEVLPVVVSAPVPMPSPVAAPVAASPLPGGAAPDDAALDKTILNTALLNGALELLPQSWASMAIIPLQVRMVYGIGRAHGVELDQGHIKEFIAAVGVGLTSQYLEQFGRKLLGGLLGKMGGKTLGKVGGVATGMAFSFATTYALGQVAKRYYAGGRVMNTDMLRDTFQSLLGPAKQMQTQYLPQIQSRAASLDAAQVMALVRGHKAVA